MAQAAIPLEKQLEEVGQKLKYVEAELEAARAAPKLDDKYIEYLRQKELNLQQMELNLQQKELLSLQAPPVAQSAASLALVGSLLKATLELQEKALERQDKSLEGQTKSMELQTKSMEQQGLILTLLEQNLQIAKADRNRRFLYTPSNATESSSKYRDPKFKPRLIQEYDCQVGPTMLRCMLLDTALPQPLVIGAHLFKHAWKYDVLGVMGFANINDQKNGLLLFELLGETTFQSLDGRRLVFTTEARPYNRCLAFQAHHAISLALAEGRITEAWLFDKDFDFYSEGSKAKCQGYLASIPPGGADMPEDDSIASDSVAT